MFEGCARFSSLPTLALEGATALFEKGHALADEVQALCASESKALATTTSSVSSRRLLGGGEGKFMSARRCFSFKANEPLSSLEESGLEE